VFDDPATTAALRSYLEEFAPVVALRLDAHDRVTAANSEAQRLLGPAVVGRPFAELIVAFTRPADLSARLRQAGVSHRFTLVTAAHLPETVDFRFFPEADGTLALGSPDFQEQVALRNQVLALNSELNNVTRQLHQTNAELRELNVLKNRFLGMAAHDLRQPVGVIMNYGTFVLDEAGPRLTEEQRDFLRTCLRAATGMRQVIDNFLDVSVIESGQLRLDPSPVNQWEIMRGVEPIARLLADRKKILLLVELAECSRRMHVDAGKIQQVLLNLLANAVEHSAPGRRVWVSTRWTESTVEWAVRDEGPGLTPEEQSRLFAAFERAATRKTAGERSTGLGLAIARLIVEAHGGRIWIESVVGQGATFRFSLPLAPPAAALPPHTP
jgi:signal transduction histidine kinase